MFAGDGGSVNVTDDPQIRGGKTTVDVLDDEMTFTFIRADAVVHGLYMILACEEESDIHSGSRRVEFDLVPHLSEGGVRAKGGQVDLDRSFVLVSDLDGTQPNAAAGIQGSEFCTFIGVADDLEEGIGEIDLERGTVFQVKANVVQYPVSHAVAVVEIA